MYGPFLCNYGTALCQYSNTVTNLVIYMYMFDSGHTYILYVLARPVLDMQGLYSHHIYIYPLVVDHYSTEDSIHYHTVW